MSSAVASKCVPYNGILFRDLRSKKDNTHTRSLLSFNHDFYLHPPQLAIQEALQSFHVDNRLHDKPESLRMPSFLLEDH